MRLPLLLAVFLTALSVLAFEVALSRAFSVLLRFHFVFLAISLATSGLGLGGLADYLTGRLLRRSGAVSLHLSLRASALAVLYPLSIYLLFATPLAGHLTSVWIVSGICILPFLVAGALLSRIFAEHSQAGGTLYFADLLGAALGSFLVIGALQLMGATNVPFVCGLAAAGAAALLAFAGGSRLEAARTILSERSRSVTARTPDLGGIARVAAVVIACLVVGGFIGNTQWRYLDLPIMPLRDDPAAKPLYRELGDP
ncbi:MAG: hypothetical protein KKI08_27940, partial [Armatimonadetes bacterium]|nr:hypothetical protein [Armatimonadota bacterium]